MRYFRYDSFRVGVRVEDPDPSVSDLIHVGEEWGLKTYLIPPQVHDYWNLYSQVEGTSEWQLGDKLCRLDPGGFWAAPPGLSHGMRQLPPERHHYFYMGFQVRPSLSRLSISPDLWPEEAINFAAAQSLFEPFRHLVREASLLRPLRSIGLRLALDTLIVEASRIISQDNTSAPVIFHPAVETVRDILEHQPGDAWKIADLANVAGVSPPHLIKLFTAEMGVSPHQYLKRVRIQRAREALVMSDISITDLALDLGYNSSQHFATAFKRVTGTTALEYRKAARLGK